MGNRASNSSTATKGFHGETASLYTAQDLKENFTKYGNLTKNGNEGDFISFSSDPRDWNPIDITPSKIFEFTNPSPPPPTQNSMAFTPSSSLSAPSTRNQKMLKRNSPCSPDQSIPKIDWDRVVMTPFSFPRSRATTTTTTSGSGYTHKNQRGEGVVSSKEPKINWEMVSSGIAKVPTKNFPKSSNSSNDPRDNNANEKGDANISQPMITATTSPISLLAKDSGSSSSASNESRRERGNTTFDRTFPECWLPDIRTSAARTNLRKKSPKSSILPFRIGKFRKRKSPPSLSKLKYTLKSSKSSKLNFKSKSLTHRKSVGKLQKHSSQHLQSISNITTPASTAIRIQNPKNDPNYDNNQTTSSSSSYQLQELLLAKNVGQMSKGSVNNRKTISPPDDDGIVSESYDETYSYSYETEESGKSASPSKKAEKNNKKNAGKRKGDPSSSGTGSEPTDAGARNASGTGTTSASTSDKSSKSKSGGYSGSKSQSGYNKKSSSYYTAGGGESGETSSSRINNRRPKKKIPPPPVFIGSSGCCSGLKKKNETPADRLKNVDIVEELIYNCPGDDDDGGCEDSCCCCNLDYYACCNECGEMELVPQCTCTQKKKPKNPVRYCRRQHFNFDDGKKGDDDCCDGPPFCWERPTNPYDDIPVGKNPVIGKDNGIRRAGCCGGDINNTATTNRHHGKSCAPDDIDGVMPAESGTYFFDAERRCFVPVVEIQEPPPPPSPEVVDEIIDEEPVLTNVEPIIQPVIQPMGGGGCCCPNGGGCPMPFFGPMTCAGMGCCNPCDGGNGSNKNDKDSSTNGGSGSSYGTSKKSKGSDDNRNPQMDNLGMMGLCGMNMNGLANMGPYGTMAMPIMKYQPPCPCPQKPQECCPCPQQCCPQQQCCQPANPICFPSYPPCPYPMYCNPMCCNGKKKKKKDKKKHKKTKDSSSGGTKTETTSTSNQTSTNTGSTNDNDDDDE